MFVLIPASELPSDDEALVTLVFVFVTLVLTEAKLAPSEVLAFVTSDWTASEPDERPAPVKVRLANDQT